MQSLCTLRNHCHQWPRNTRYQADAIPYLGRTSTGWIAPALRWRTYSITSSARARSEGGIVIPIALAVLKLMISSNFVGCSIGSSLGLAPLRRGWRAGLHASKHGGIRARRTAAMGGEIGWRSPTY